MKNLALIYNSVSSGYRDELRTYAGLNSVNVPNDALPPNAFAIFVKMFYLFSKLGEGHIDLATVTYGDLSTPGRGYCQHRCGSGEWLSGFCCGSGFAYYRDVVGKVVV
ncbi:MAG: hypothetical protein PHO32_03355 [Candidatus Cloacimonetes bacterium]|nr:hypothetical protein [Candidatus Cloacimonadota bacterium]